MNNDLDRFAHLDMDRKNRTGIAEAVYCAGKTPAQVSAIFEKMKDAPFNVIGTRASREYFDAVRESVPEAEYYPEAKIIGLLNDDTLSGGRILVAAAGTSDIPVAEEAAVSCTLMGRRVDRLYDVGIAGIHRLLSQEERLRSADAVIAAAGMEGALAGVIAGLVSAPVVAVPTSVGYGANFGGVSALLTMLNSCAPGIGVVNIDNGYGAAALACKMTAER